MMRTDATEPDISNQWGARRSHDALPRTRSGVDFAILIPCYNEAKAVSKVVNDFKRACPTARIYVYDNNSTDETCLRAREAGAIVRAEPQQGKGNVVRRMFADVDADVFILVDGDGTYDASAAPVLIDKLISENLDFVNGARLSTDEQAYRPGHRFGNYLLTAIVRNIFGRQFKDMLSGYKVLSRRFVKSFPATSRGFEIETEIAVHALELRVPCAEIATNYNARTEGSQSKLRTYRDGFKILLLIARLIKDERPLQFFGLSGFLLVLAALWLSIPIWEVFLETGTVPRLPTAVLCVGLVLSGTLSFLIGLILEMVSRTRLEMKRLCYLQSH
ncbi:glycosyltransferase [Rhizobium sp. P32RR-XVIII]|uniref:glycosyltransferase n=1 Tax=Rhizobium sp. P32RR-XVIII TaxID=2726738 RepID=UPI001FEF29C3|nr:glycosyltransferase [Rhizobium sp. P32RR-XVIII]